MNQTKPISDFTLIFALFAPMLAACGSSGGGDPLSFALNATYDLLVEEQGDSFVSRYPDPFAYSDVGWELYREAGFGTLSWSGSMTGHELSGPNLFGDYEAISNLTGRVCVTINGVDGQNTRVSFSEVTEQVSGTSHNIPDLMFSLLPHLEAGTRKFFLDHGYEPPSAWIQINKLRLVNP